MKTTRWSRLPARAVAVLGMVGAFVALACGPAASASQVSQPAGSWNATVNDALSLAGVPVVPQGSGDGSSEGEKPTPATALTPTPTPIWGGAGSTGKREGLPSQWGDLVPMAWAHVFWMLVIAGGLGFLGFRAARGCPVAAKLAALFGVLTTAVLVVVFRVCDAPSTIAAGAATVEGLHTRLPNFEEVETLGVQA